MNMKKGKMDSNNPCSEEELKESIQTVVLVVFPADHWYAMKNVLCCTHVSDMNEAICITLFK
jgi:hypothetical protein